MIMKMRLPRLNPRLLTAIAAVSLAACAGGKTVSRVDIAHRYLPEELYVVATSNNELQTIVVGEPFDMPKDEFDQAVLASMARQNFGPQLNLSTDPKQEDGRKRQVVLVFNLTGIVQTDSLCSGTTETAKPADGALTVTGVYCDGGGRFLTTATTRADGVTAANTEQFRRMMSQLAISLFPDDNPHRRGEGESCFNC